MKTLAPLLLGTAAVLLTAVPAHAATIASPPKAYECVAVGPVDVLNQPVIPDQYEVCVPTPASSPDGPG
ncbi:MAG: hypothetical protein NVSMB29_19690 [Candidatus Dormibacteria bacterium]